VLRRPECRSALAAGKGGKQDEGGELADKAHHIP
jgi:hypothetical protein